MKIMLFSDGGSRGNPGPAAIGIVIRQIDKEKDRSFDRALFESERRGRQTSESMTGQVSRQIDLKEISEFIGVGTNNIAEYTAILEGLKWIKENIDISNLSIECFLDSQLVVEQLCGRYKMKNEGLKPLFWEIRDLVLALGGEVSFKHIPREQNSAADALVNKALDKELKGDK